MEKLHIKFENACSMLLNGNPIAPCTPEASPAKRADSAPTLFSLRSNQAISWTRILPMVSDLKRSKHLLSKVWQCQSGSKLPP